MAERKYTFVTVVFEQEYELLRLQARSLRIYCRRDLVASIIVVENTLKTMPARTRRRIVDEYGDLAGLVRFLRSSDIGVDPAAKWGWWTQQVVKLMVAKIVDTDRYVSLDAKNHLVFPLQRGFLETPDDRGRLRCFDYTENSLREHFGRVLTYIGLDVPSHFTQSSTPFVLYTGIVRKMIEDICRRERKPFPEFFLAGEFAEFILYAAYIIKTEGSIDAFYATHDRFNPIIWPQSMRPEGCREMIGWTDAELAPFFGVHRRTIVQLNSEAEAIVTDFWCERGVFNSPGEARSFIAGFRRRERARIRRTLPGRAARRIKGVLRRLLPA